MNYKQDAENKGNTMANALSKMKYFRWSVKDGYFKQFKPFKGVPNGRRGQKFLKERDKYNGEIALIRMIEPYTAYITAPTEFDSTDVIERQYAKYRQQRKSIRNAHGILTDPNGFTQDHTTKERFDDYDRFEYTFKKICEIIEKKIQSTAISLN